MYLSRFRMGQRILTWLYIAIICYSVVVAAQTNHRYGTLARRSNVRKIQNRATFNANQGMSERLTNPTAIRSVVTSQNDNQLSQAMVDMALNIGRSTAEQNTAVEIFSPVSIMGVLNILLLSADGLTRTELLNALKLNNNVRISDYHRRAAGLIANLLDKNPKELDRLSWKTESCVADDYEDDQDNEIVVPK